ncbi:MAG: DUF2190 family protein [Candidatus Bathyarchaeota archaeon]|nr:DUF2190 family protein [Candidatus Bathyarchaeota archaeon]
MTAGDIMKEGLLVIEEFTVKADEDIEKGEVVYNDGNGILAATNTAKGPYFVALEAHDYSEEANHKVRCVVSGCVECQKVSGSGGGKQGQFVEVSATGGEVQLFDYTTPGNWYDVVGELAEDAADADTTAKIWLGKR